MQSGANTMNKIVGWTGAGFMMGFSFTLIVPLGIIGLSLLTIQAMEERLWNLVGLNLASIVGLTLQVL
jgi:hypothetical protein